MLDSLRKPSKVFFTILLLVIVGELVIIAPSLLDLGKEDSSNEVQQVSNTKVEQALTGIHLVEASKEKKEWELDAEQAQTLQNKVDWNLKKVKAKFFGKNGVVIDVVGNTGRVDTRTKNMDINGQVLIKTSNGYAFTTEEVNYDSKLKKLFSHTEVKMRGPPDETGDRMILTGSELEVSLGDSMMYVKKDVKAEKTIRPEKKVHISSQRAEFSSESKYARFLDNVVVDFSTMRITGPDAVFNYDKTKGAVSSMAVQGGVRVSDIDKFATSENVNIEFNDEKYTFRGQPRVVQNNDELKGDEIVFYNGGKKVQVKGARANIQDVERNGPTSSKQKDSKTKR